MSLIVKKNKKVLVADPISPKGHYMFNKNLISTLSNNFDIDFIGDTSLINWLEQKINDIQYFRFKTINRRKNDFRKGQISRIREIKKLCKSIKYDAVIFSSYDTFSLFFFSEDDFKSKVLLINHNNLSKINSFIRKEIFKKVYNSFSYHLLFEEKFKFNLEKILNRSLEKCYIVPHFLAENNLININSNNKNKMIKILYLGNDRYDKGLDVLIGAVNRFGDNWTDKLEINVAGKLSRSYKCNKIRFKNYRLSDTEYYQLLNETDYVILPYREIFINRVSGIFFESLSCEKPIIASDIDIFKYYFDKYGDLGFLFKEGDEKSLYNLLLLLQSNGNIEKNKFIKNIKEMKSNYSKKYILKCFNQIIDE